MRIARAVGSTVRGRLCRSWVGVMVVCAPRMVIARIVMTAIRVIGSLGIISRVSAGSPRIRGVSPVGVSFWMSVVMVMDVRLSGGCGCSGGRCGSRGRLRWFLRTVIRYSCPFIACFRS